MTKINRITIHGFKSFAHKTEIPFTDKFNCILGPNGSGKSNIGDSICFVLGRLSAKSMRAEKAANLIFNGGKDKKPATAGTVEMVFSNENKVFPEKADEVAISRTITMSGNSIYRINGAKKTRTEVLDFLSLAKINPEGYNIILQGDITRFVEMSPLDRRKIIEEISDVSLYEEKKHKAVLELTKVEEKLNSADIILKERKTYLKELSKDREQALKFRELKEKIDSNRATAIHIQMKERETIKAQFDQDVAKHDSKIKETEKEITELKERINDHKKAIAGINQEVEQKGEKAQLAVHRQIEDLKISITKDRARMSTLKDEINKINLRKDQFTQEIAELEEKASSFSSNKKEFQSGITLKNKEFQQWEQQIAQFKKKHKIESSQEFDQEIEQKEKIIDEKQEKVQISRQQQQELLREKDKLEYQVQTIDEKVKKVKEVTQQNEGQVKLLQEHKSNFKKATLRLNQVLDQDSSFSSQLANARRRLVELQEKNASLNAKTLSHKANLASNQAIQNILDNKKKFEGVYGTVMELGQVNRKYSVALETAAGPKMQNIVVDTDKTAAECINYLQKNKLGMASFIPLNKIRTQDISSEDKGLLKKSGVHDFALNLISFKPKYEKAFSSVFGNTLVVEDINIAREVGVGRIRMATIDGNSVEASGVMRGGFKERKAALGFQEKDSLEELERVESEINEQHGVLSTIETKRQANDQEVSALRHQKAELEAEIITLEKTLHLHTDDLDATTTLKKELVVQLKDVNDKLDAIHKEIGLENKDLANLKSQKQMLRTKVNELRDPRLLAQLQAFEESKHTCKEDFLRLEGDLKNTTTQIEQLIAPEREKIREIMTQHEKEEITFSEEIKKLTTTAVQKEKELALKEKESADFYSKYRALFTEREKLSMEIAKAENNVEQNREKARFAEREMNLISLKNAEVKAKLAGLQEEFSRFTTVSLIKNKTLPELQQEISKFEVMMGQMSAVNMKALEVYEQVEKEYNSLIAKKDSLDKEKVDVLTLMNEIETKKKDHFMKTYVHANKNFERIFSTLFKKGKAYLELENPDQPFEEGLNIKVKLAGNRFMDIKSLSGGEKTLTALSFIFAIQEHQPASFYILDEIDAALDKHNSERLSKLISNYTDRAQYIVISHNDALISEADTLYGISMNDGVSKVTSLKI
ncbi:MAG: chromosome segregation protein SMC [Nanoarchaeota archaeon]|nr:chromosome segregation protein SMC [Nanoarchaeota archaeon]